MWKHLEGTYKWKMFSKSVMVLLKDRWKAQKCHQKALGFFRKMSKKLENVLKNRYAPFGKN